MRQQRLFAAESQSSQASDKSSADTDTELPVQTVEHAASEPAEGGAMPRYAFVTVQDIRWRKGGIIWKFKFTVF